MNLFNYGVDSAIVHFHVLDHLNPDELWMMLHVAADRKVENWPRGKYKKCAERLKKLGLVELNGDDISLVFDDPHPTRDNETYTPPPPTIGFVYIACDKTHQSRFKIGFSKDPKRREKDFQAANPDITIPYAVPGLKFSDERSLHAELSLFRSVGEWFECEFFWIERAFKRLFNIKLKEYSL